MFAIYKVRAVTYIAAASPEQNRQGRLEIENGGRAGQLLFL